MIWTRSFKPLLPALLAAGSLLVPLRVFAEPSVPVRVTNLPVTQAVAGTVNIGNTVPVTVTNLPATQAVTGTVNIGNPVQISGPVAVTGSVEATLAPGSVSATLAPGAVVGINNGTSYQKFSQGSSFGSGVHLANPAVAGQQLVLDSIYVTASANEAAPTNPMIAIYGAHTGNSGLLLDFNLLVPCQVTASSPTSYSAGCNLLQSGIVLPPGQILLVTGFGFNANLDIVQFGRIVPTN